MRLPTWITPSRAILFAVVLVAIALRLTGLGHLPPGLYPDEAVHGNDALRALSGGWSWFYPDNGGMEGLFTNLQAVALWITGLREPWVLRLVSAIAGILTVPGLYLLGKELWSRRVGLIAAALLAGSFWHVVFSRVGFRAILAPLLLVYALALLLMGIRRLGEDGRPGWPLVILGGALAGLGFHTYIAYRAMALVFIAAGLALVGTSAPALRKRVWTGLAVAGIAACIVAAPLLRYFATHPGTFSERTAQVSVFKNPHPVLEIGKNVALEAGMLVTRGDANWRHNDAGEPEVPFAVFLAMLAGIACAGMMLIRKRGRDVPGITILALVIAGAAPAILSDEGMPHALRSICLLVPVMLLAAYGLERIEYMLARIGWKQAGTALIVVVCAYAALQTSMRYPAYAQKPEVRAEFTKRYLDVGRELLRRDLDRPAYVIVPHNDILIDGIPVAAQTPMFISGTATRDAQERGDVHYVSGTDTIPAGAAVYNMTH